MQPVIPVSSNASNFVGKVPQVERAGLKQVTMFLKSLRAVYEMPNCDTKISPFDQFIVHYLLSGKSGC